jgi:hypothetical protein
MKRNSCSASQTRKAVVVTIGTCLAICFLRLGDDGAAWGHTIRSALGMYNSEYRTSHFPITRSTYDSQGGTDYVSPPQNVQVSGMELKGPPLDAAVIPLPPLGASGQIDSFFDMFTELKIGKDPIEKIDINGAFTFRISNGGSGGGSTYDTEMLSMNLSGVYQGSGGPIPFLIRESPTLQSPGQHSVAPVGDGTFLINSFFDVFTELSLDGGATFSPASSSFRLNLASVPEPATIALAMIGVGGVGVICRRSRIRVYVNSICS